MKVLDLAQSMADEQLKKKVSSRRGAFVWFVSECVQLILFVVGALMLLWLYAPFSFFLKFLLSLLGGIVVYDMFKSFVWVRWILLKDG